MNVFKILDFINRIKKVWQDLQDDGTVAKVKTFIEELKSSGAIEKIKSLLPELQHGYDLFAHVLLPKFKEPHIKQGVAEIVDKAKEFQESK